MINKVKKVNISSNSTISSNRRFADLARFGEVVFHIDDVANLWNIRNRNTLRTTLSRYVAKGLIFRLQKGLYAMKPLKDLDPYVVGLKALHQMSYISCESMLYDNGVINQSPREVTIVSAMSKRYLIGNTRYRSRQMSDRFLYNTAGIEIVHGVRIASVERAIADMLYFNPRSYLDAHTSRRLVDWKKVRALARKIGYTIVVPTKIS